MTTQPDRERKPDKGYADDDHDPILNAAEDMAQLFRAQDEDGYDEAHTEEQEE